MNNKIIGTENNIIFYEDENNNTKVEVRLLNEDVWLTMVNYKFILLICIIFLINIKKYEILLY